ncbi:flippase [Pseudomonas stutzeri]|uniref:flippase n=1 Tax=Stutzerimonas stutzeri TaxID=316 RepID=UPI00210DC00C|nr:flippase [Stutzerimonas stutzeri]MCQ4230887.1 flippase [Stutzerimonas stutzeri]
MFKKIKKELQGELVKRVTNNIGWLFLDNLLKLIVGLFVVIFLARYLGPEGFGLYNYVSAFVAIFAPFATLGLYSVVVRDLVNRKDHDKIITNAAIIMLIGAVISYLAMVFLIGVMRPGEADVKIITSLLGLTLLFKTSFIMRFWFEAEIVSKYAVYVESSVFLVAGLVKLIFIYLKLPLICFVIVLLFESIFVFFGYCLAFRIARGKRLEWSFDWGEIKYLLHQSWPLIISGAAWILYTKIDQIMIGQMIGDQAVGVYAAASKLSEVAVMVPTIIALSIVPVIMKSKENSLDAYRKQFQQLYDCIVFVTVSMALCVTLLSDEIVSILYGAEYKAAASILTIQFWVVIFIGLAIVSGRFFVNEGMQRITMQRHIIGLVLNFLLNFYFIPSFGIEGAAYASLASMFFANYFYDLLVKETREVFYQKTKALVFVWLFKFYKKA